MEEIHVFGKKGKRSIDAELDKEIKENKEQILKMKEKMEKAKKEKEIHVFDKDDKRSIDAADHLLAAGTALPPTTDENYFSEFVGDVYENFRTAYKKHASKFQETVPGSHEYIVQEMLHSAYEFTMKEWEFQQRTYAKRKGF